MVGLLVLVAACLVATAVLGPAMTGVIDYHFGESMTNQGIGLDWVAIGLVAPVALLAAWLVHREWLAGPVLAFVPGVFSAYMAPQYVIGPDYLGLPGNNERFLLLHLALFVFGVATTVVAWQQVDRIHLLPDTRASDRRRMAVLGVLGGLVLLRWLPEVVALTAGEAVVDPVFADNPTAFLLIAILDLGLVVPAAVTAAVGLHRGAVWARTAAYVVFGFFATVPLSVAAMAIVMVASGDELGSIAAAIGFGVAAVVSLVAVVVLYRPLFRERVSIVPPEWSLEHDRS